MINAFKVNSLLPLDILNEYFGNFAFKYLCLPDAV